MIIKNCYQLIAAARNYIYHRLLSLQSLCFYMDKYRDTYLFIYRSLTYRFGVRYFHKRLALKESQLQI